MNIRQHINNQGAARLSQDGKEIVERIKTALSSSDIDSLTDMQIYNMYKNTTLFASINFSLAAQKCGLVLKEISHPQPPPSRIIREDNGMIRFWKWLKNLFIPNKKDKQ